MSEDKMDKDKFKFDENDENFEEIINEANKIVLILPHVPLLDIIKTLSNLPKEDRLSTFLNNYFQDNPLSTQKKYDYEVDFIHNTFPMYSKEDISIDLSIVRNLKNHMRVQYVVKQYLNKIKTINRKRNSEPREINCDETVEKKVKLVHDDSAQCFNSYNYNNEKDNNTVTVLSALNDVLPNKSMVELIQICNLYGFKCNDKISINELNHLLEQILCEKDSKLIDNQQPSTSSCGYEQVPTSSNNSSTDCLNQANSQETLNTSSLTENYDYLEEDFITQKEPSKEEQVPVKGEVEEQKEVEIKEETTASSSNKIDTIDLTAEPTTTALVDLSFDSDSDNSFDGIGHKQYKNEEYGTTQLLLDEFLNEFNNHVDHVANPQEQNNTTTNINNIDNLNNVDNLPNIENINNIHTIVDAQHNNRDLNQEYNEEPNNILDLLTEITELTETRPKYRNIIKVPNGYLAKPWNMAGKRSVIDDWNIMKRSNMFMNPLNMTRPRNTDLNIAGPSRVRSVIRKFENVQTKIGNVSNRIENVRSKVENASNVLNLKSELQNGTSKVENVKSELKKRVPDDRYIKIKQMFPDICPDYLKNRLASDNHHIEVHIDQLLNTDYPKVEVQERVPTPPQELCIDEVMNTLEDLFPDCDPTFLQKKGEQFVRMNDYEMMQRFIHETLESNNYPTREEYLKKLKLSAQEKKYTTEFSVENFLEVIPEPEVFFNKPDRMNPLKDRRSADYEYKLMFFKNHFNNYTIRDIQSILSQANTLVQAAEALENFPKHMKSKRKVLPLPSCDNIPLLQELAYIKHKKEILNYIKKKEEAERQERILAKENGQLKTCQCCFDDEVMPRDIVCCDKQHEFCKTCVKKSAEVQIGLGKLNFPCLEDCQEEFCLKTLQIVLPPNMFSKMALKKQLEEIKAAGIEDLISCPFCDFATILPPTEKIFRCLNEECMKESCRECKEPSHIPLRCDEVEKDADIKKRTYIENKMTEALLRTCWKCGMKFVKEGGCNKMTCSCGAMMCYLCNQPVKDYKHFNGQGGEDYHLCPLFSDTIKLHEEAVLQGAAQAKQELGIKNEELKVDPTEGIKKHFEDVKKRNPHHDHILNQNVQNHNNNRPPVFNINYFMH